MKIISIVNQKGGVAKTTVAGNLAAILGHAGFRTLAVDFDQQMGLTSQLGFNVYDLPAQQTLAWHLNRMAEQNRSFDHLDAVLPASEVTLRAELAPRLDLMTCGRGLTMTLRMKTADPDGIHLLAPVVRGLGDAYDFVIVDTHPDLGLSTAAVLTASDYYLIPVFPEEGAVRGLVELNEFARRVKHSHNPKLEALGYLVSRFDKKVATHGEYVEAMESQQLPLFSTRIPSAPGTITAAEKNHLPVVLHKNGSSAVAKAYVQFANELMQRVAALKSSRSEAAAG